MKICMTGNVFPFGEGLSYGGERMIYYLVRSLSKMGHEIYLFASHGTNVPKKYIRDYIPVGPLEPNKDVYYQAALKYMGDHGISFDIYQCNYFGDGWEPEILNRFPYVELTWCKWSHIYWQLRIQNINTISYSKTLQDDFLQAGAKTIRIPYGLPKDLYSFHPESEDYVVWIGKMEYGKNMKGAIELALAADMKIVLMGPPYNMDHWRKQVVPYLRHPKVFWVRGVDDFMKERIMGNAKAFISSNGNTWKEHFGIVNLEALAMGVPIIGFNRINQNCAIVEDQIIEDGKEGFILNYTDSENIAETIEKGLPLLRRIGEISREDCRKRFEKLWTSEIMASRYDWLYKQVHGGAMFETVEIPL